MNKLCTGINIFSCQETHCYAIKGTEVLQRVLSEIRLHFRGFYVFKKIILKMTFKMNLKTS